MDKLLPLLVNWLQGNWLLALGLFVAIFSASYGIGKLFSAERDPMKIAADGAGAVLMLVIVLGLVVWFLSGVLHLF